MVRSINKELLHKVITNEVELYKLSIDDSDINIYGEGAVKVYYNPVKMCALIQHDPSVTQDGEIIIDKTKDSVFGFLKDDLKNYNVVIEVGDIISWDAIYYEVDNIRTNQYWMGRNNQTLIANSNDFSTGFGYAISVIAECHQTKESSLQLSNTNYGIPKTQLNFSLPKNL